KTFKNVLSSFFVTKIMLVICLICFYMIFVIYWLSRFGLWNYEQLKNTIFWCVSVAFMSLFKISQIKKDRNFIKNEIFAQLKILAIIQFIISVYSFSLWFEIILVPILTIIGLIFNISKKDEKYIQAKKTLECCLILFGIASIGFTSYMLITNFSEFGRIKTVYDFFTPPLLSLCYIPLLLFMIIYSSYEDVFNHLNIAIKNRFHRYTAKFYAVVLFNFHINLLERWSHQVSKVQIESHADLINTFKHILKVRTSEKNPKEISKELGWSPYEAKNFLINEGLGTGFYNLLFEDEWFASSPMKEFGNDLIPSNIAYYIEGSEDIVTLLKIKVNINNILDSQQACDELRRAANTLSVSSLNKPLSVEMTSAIMNNSSYSEKHEEKTISLNIEHWKNNKFNGYEQKFTISTI
ncbi:TPA: hypothetical protein ACYRT0_004773, partial [Escherichia coli]